MSDLDDKLIIEAMSRRGFLDTLGKAAAAAGLSPKLPIPNFSDDEDDDDDDDDYEGDDWTDVEGHDIEDWINDNVLDYTIDQAIGDSKISNSLVDKIQKIVSDIIGSGEDISNDLMVIFSKQLNDEMSRGKRFYETIEDPEFVELMIANMTKAIHNQLDLKQVIAKAAARELKGDKPEDILKDVDAEFEAKLDAEWYKRNNPIGYSKFDTAGGKRDYEYTADSYIMSNKDSKMLSEAYLNEIRLRGPWDEMPQGSSGRMEFNPYDKGNEYSYPSRENKPSLSKKKDNITVKGNDLENILDSSEKYYSDPNNIFQSSVNERLEDRGFFIGVLPTEEQRFILARYVKPEEVEVIGGFTTWEDALQTAKNTPGTGITNV